MILDLCDDWFVNYPQPLKNGGYVTIETYKEIYNYRESERFEVIYTSSGGFFKELKNCIVLGCSVHNRDPFNKKLIISYEKVNYLSEYEFISKTRVWKIKQIL